MEGAVWRQDRAEELGAWISANIMNASGNFKSPVSMDRLLGPEHRIRQLRAAERRHRRAAEET